MRRQAARLDDDMQLHLTNPQGKGWSERRNNILYVLGTDHPPPQNSLIVSDDFMIVAKLGKHPRGFIVEPIDTDMELVNHNGFERLKNGDIRAWSPTLGKFISAGKLTNAIYVANTTQTELHPIKIPGVCYVRRGESRLAGIPHIQELHRSELS